MIKTEANKLFQMDLVRIDRMDGIQPASGRSLRKLCS